MEIILHINYNDLQTIMFCLNKELFYIDSEIDLRKKILHNPEETPEHKEEAHSVINVYKQRKNDIIGARNRILK